MGNTKKGQRPLTEVTENQAIRLQKVAGAGHSSSLNRLKLIVGCDHQGHKSDSESADLDDLFHGRDRAT